MKLNGAIKKKLHGEKGLSIVEMLAAVLVLSLLCIMLFTGLNMAVDGYRSMIAEAETQLLLSSVSNVLSDELRYAREVATSADGTLSYTSISYGRYTTLELNDGQLEAGGKRILAAGAYGNGAYRISDFNFSYDEATGLFTVFVKVLGEDNITAETELLIQCLNADD